MPWRKALLAISAAAVVAVTFASTDAEARRRGARAMSPDYYDRYYCGRLPAYGFDGCGRPEFSYGPDSCYTRVIVNTRSGPVPRQGYICG